MQEPQTGLHSDPHGGNRETGIALASDVFCAAQPINDVGCIPLPSLMVTGRTSVALLLLPCFVAVCAVASLLLLLLFFFYLLLPTEGGILDG